MFVNTVPDPLAAGFLDPGAQPVSARWIELASTRNFPFATMTLPMTVLSSKLWPVSPCWMIV